MAINVLELQATTDYYVDSTPKDIYFKDNVFLYLLLSKGKTVSGGRKLKSILEYGKSNSGTYGASTKLPTSKKEIYTEALFPWAAYFAQITYDLDDDLQNNGDQAIVNLVNGKMKNAEKSIRESMSIQIFDKRENNVDETGKETGWCGLADLFDTTATKEYGEIREADLADWKANVIDTAATMSFKLMQQIRRTASVGNSKESKPNLYLTTDTLVDAFEASQQAQLRYRSEKLLDAGFDNILFKNAPLVADDRQSAGYIDALNLNFLDIKTHTKRNFTSPKWSSPNDQPDTMTAYIRYAGQLTCANRKAHCRHKQVAAA